MPLPAEWRALEVSLWVSWWASLLVMGPALALAYYLSRPRAPLRGLVNAVVHLPLVLPPVATGYVLLIMLAPHGPLGWLGWLLTWKAAAVAGAVLALPLAVGSMRVAMEGVDPRIEQAARTLGAGPWRVFWTITLPLARRGLVAAWVLAFARSLGEFGATILVAGNIPGRTQTVPLALFTAVETGHPEAALRLVSLATLASVVCLVIAERLTRRAL